MHVWQFALFLTPYHALAVAALFTHVGCALYWTRTRHSPRAARSALVGMGVFGAVFGALIVGALAGWLVPVTIGTADLATYGGRASSYAPPAAFNPICASHLARRPAR